MTEWVQLFFKRIIVGTYLEHLRMGQKKSTDANKMVQKANIPSYALQWSVIYSDSVNNWIKQAGAYGFCDHPYGCLDRDCDRDSICLKRARVALKKNNHSIQFHQFHQPTKLISYSLQTVLQRKVAQGFKLSETVATLRDTQAIVIFYHWERLRYEATFALINLKTNCVVGHFESPTINMSIMECEISPDGFNVAILFYFKPDISSCFQYDLYVFDLNTFLVTDILRCNTEVRPYITFDPRYRYSRLAIVNYSDEDVKNGLVLYCLDSHQVLLTSHLKLSVISGGGYFCANYSKGGHHLILQKISDSMNGMHCYADSYIFDSDDLKLVKYYYASLQPSSTLCESNYAPLFSHCGSRMCILSEEQVDDARRLHVSVYQLPRPLRLQDQCRISVLQNLATTAHIAMLPIPNKIKEYLYFCPALS